MEYKFQVGDRVRLLNGAEPLKAGDVGVITGDCGFLFHWVVLVDGADEDCPFFEDELELI